MNARPVALMTGASSGLGMDHARQLAARFVPRAWLRAGIDLVARRFRDRLAGAPTRHGGSPR